MKPLEVTYKKTVQIVDADEVAIFPGSVLQEIEDGARGVVTYIGVAGEISCTLGMVEGDMSIHIGTGHTRVSNRYSKWRHIPHAEQTYEERLQSWLHSPYFVDEYRGVPKAEALAIDGIMALLPDDIVDWDRGPTPDRLEDVLVFLQQHLTELKKASNTP